MIRRMRWQLLVVGLFGCGISANAPGDGSNDAGGATLQTDNGVGGLVSIVEFENALVGQSSAAVVNFVNRGTSPTGPIDLAITGPNEDEFSISTADSTCIGATLSGLGRCVVVLNFRPTAAGTRTAALTFSSSPGGSGSVALSSFVLLPSVHFEPTVLELPVMQVGSSMTRTLQLRNEGGLSVSLRDVQATGPNLTMTGTTCASVLAAHSRCDIAFVATPIATGRQVGLVQATADGAMFAAPIRVRGAREVTIAKQGNGGGRVTAITVGIDCGATCRALTTSDVTFTADPDSSSVLTGWSVPTCGANRTCSVPLDAFPARLTATFVRSSSTNLTLAFAGTGAGEARVRSASGEIVANCYSTCTIPVNADKTYTIDVTTWSTFAGFGAPCTSSQTGSCQVTTTAGMTTVALTFDKRPGERYTRFLPSLPLAVDLDADENAIALTADRLIKLSPTGATVWSMPFEGTQVDTGPQGAVYAVGTQNAFAGLFKFDATGALQWKVPIQSGYFGGNNTSIFANSLAVAADGSVVSIGPIGVVRWDSSGAVAWSRSLDFASVGGVGVQPDGTVVVGREAGDKQLRTVTGERFAAGDGSPLSGLGTIGKESRGALAVDGAGEVAMHNSGVNSIVFQWRSHTASDTTGGEPFLETGTCVTAGPAVFVANRKGNTGWMLGRMAADGAMISSSGGELFTDFGFGPQRLEHIACARASGAYLIGGNYSGFTTLTESPHSNSGYVQLID